MYKAYGIQTLQLPPIRMYSVRGAEQDAEFLLAAGYVHLPRRAPTDAARNRLGSMSPSCAGDSMPESFYFAVSSRLPSHAFHRIENGAATLRARNLRACSQRPL